MTTYLPERVWPRFVPKGSIAVSIFGGEGEHGFGVLSDLSQGGARVVADDQFTLGCKVLLRIGFDPDAPFSLPGEIVWVQESQDPAPSNSTAYGVKFRLEDPEQAARLVAILESPDFEPPAVPALRADRR